MDSWLLHRWLLQPFRSTRKRIGVRYGRESVRNMRRQCMPTGQLRNRASRLSVTHWGPRARLRRSERSPLAEDGIGYLSFRGTDNLSNWLSDFHFTPSGKPLRHRGFRNCWQRLRPQVENWLARQKPSEIILTGHSLGAPWAQLAAFDLRRVGGSTRSSVLVPRSSGGGNSRRLMMKRGAIREAPPTQLLAR